MNAPVTKDSLKAGTAVRSEQFEAARPSAQEAEAAVRTLLRWAGDDPDREGLLGTPDRVVRSYREFFSGYEEDPVEILSRTFEETGGYDEIVLLKDIRIESHCEHHMVPMQIAIAQELEGLPEFRKFGGFTAYIEGWALYAERLAKEMGFYREPLSDFGRLAWELLRAARLVVDTGLHHKRWTRDEAISYLDETLPVTHEINRKAIERYIVWPSQATAYKVGMMASPINWVTTPL